MKVLRGTSLALMATVLLVGCKPDAALKKSETIGDGVSPAHQPGAAEPHSADGAVPNLGPGPSASSYSGSVSGTVSFVGQAPKRVEIDTSMDPACSFASAGKVYAEQVVVNKGKLQNVFLYVKAGPDAAMSAGPLTNQTVVLDQKGCQYMPHVIGVMQGGTVEFRNSDPTMHNIHTMPTTVGNETIDVSQGPKGQPVLKRLAKTELMIPVRCNNHPWMNAFINVAPSPFFAVTDAAGNFTIHGLPAGTYTIGAVQEKLGEKTMQVTVPANGAGTAKFSFGQ